MRGIIFILILMFASTDIYSFELPHSLPTHTYKKSEVECIALNIFFEARGKSNTLMEKFAISFVVMTRKKSWRWPNNICDVLKQPQQFSWYNNGKYPKVDWKNPLEVRAWNESVDIANAFLSLYQHNLISDFTGGADHYHATYSSPPWNNDMNLVGQYGQHVFWIDELRK